MKVDLRGKTALVTGAGNGIGKAIALALARNGARVACCDRDGDAAARTALLCGDGHLGLTMDIADADAVGAGIAQASAQLDGVHIVVNNAGVGTLERATLDAFSFAEWKRVLDINLDGFFHVSQTASRLMIAAGKGGRIINVGSVVGLVPLRLQSPYVASKAAITALTRSMALEFAPHGILVNGIAPGSTLTETTEKYVYGNEAKFPELRDRLISHVPLGRPGTVDEIAVAALFLADPDNSYMTGRMLSVDGGWTAGFSRDF